MQRIIFVFGLSGAGKSTVANALEDCGYKVVDGLPLSLVDSLIAACGSQNPPAKRLAVVLDVQGTEFASHFLDMAGALRARGQEIDIIFLDATDDTLIRRYRETRRRHPQDQEGDLRLGIAAERQLLLPLAHVIGHVIRTDSLTVHDLTHSIRSRYESEDGSMLSVTVMSFGYKHGVPLELDLCFDARFLPNPYFVDGLRELTGLNPAVSDYVLKHSESQEFLDKLAEFLFFLLPLYRREGKAYLTVAMGCTGGQHRSPALAEALADRLKIGDAYRVNVKHRDI